MLPRTWTLTSILLLSTSPAFAQVTEEISEGASELSESVSETASELIGGSRYSLRYAERPLTLGARMLGADGALSITKLGDFDAIIGLALGGTYGVTDDLEVGAVVLPLVISPDFEFGNITANAVYRFLRGNLEVGAGVEITLPIRSGTDFGLELSAPVLLRLGQMRIDTGVVLSLSFSDPLGKTLSFPFLLWFQVNDSLAVGGTSGLVLPNLDDLAIPLGVQALYALPGPNGPMLDIGPFFAFPLLLALTSDGDKLITDYWVLGVIARFYIFM